MCHHKVIFFFTHKQKMHKTKISLQKMREHLIKHKTSDNQHMQKRKKKIKNGFLIQCIENFLLLFHKPNNTYGILKIIRYQWHIVLQSTLD